MKRMDDQKKQWGREKFLPCPICGNLLEHFDFEIFPISKSLSRTHPLFSLLLALLSGLFPELAVKIR